MSDRVHLLPIFYGLIVKHHGKEYNKILDVGCGNLYLYWRRRLGEAYVGLDNRKEVYPDVVGDACDLELFDADSFDIVTGFSVVEHVKEPYRMLEEAVRVSRATVIVTTDYTKYDKDADETHLYSWTPKTFQQLCEAVHKPCQVYVDWGMIIGVFKECNVNEI